MSRICSRSLTRTSLRSPTALISHHRHGSNKTHRAQLIEVELDSSSSQSDSPDGAEVVTVGIGRKKIEEAIQSMIIRHAAPDWLPFLPGYSYWVPPHASAVRSHRVGGIVEALSQIVSSGVIERSRILSRDGLSEDEQMSVSLKRGWPSASYFIEGDTSIPIQVMEVQLKLQDAEGTGNDESNSEDEH